ncbi:MAG TPA: SsrA-binding protein [Lentisphaeria bacterium]|nr:MAG: SsrA-binding protein [Lentisphaerae bacterium GWF2_49_21]HBC86501.1 SsrA-binding protein [Lentisphaeria bacterium]
MEKILTENRKAFHDYHILDRFEAGIELKGTEVKSCRARSISLNDAYAKAEENEIFLFNSHIAVYEHGNIFNHEPLRKRKLLLHKREIRKLVQATREKGNTIIPLKFYLKDGMVKVEIAIAKGKTHGDKRETLRKKQSDIDMKRAMSSRKR